MRQILLVASFLLLGRCALAAETDASKSVAAGAGLLLATAGQSASFTITARDESGNNNQAAGDIFLVELSGTRSLRATVANQLDGTHHVTYTASKSGAYEAAVKLAKSGGLLGAYYENVWFFYTPVKTVVDPQINMDWGTGLLTPTGADYVSIRWQGKVLTQYAETYTFYATTDDGARLYVDNTLIIDRWDSFCNETRATVQLAAGYMYDIKMEYKEVTDKALAKLSWSSASVPKEVVPAGQLYFETHIKSSPFKIVVQPAEACGSTSTAAGSGLSAATVGTATTLTVQANDEFANARGPGTSDIFTVRLVPPGWGTGGRAAHALMVDNTDSTYSAEYTSFITGNSSLQIALLHVGGLDATYYNEVSMIDKYMDGSTAKGNLYVETIDWSGLANQVPFTGLVGDNLWVVRWSGFIKPSVDADYTFYATINDPDERVQLWVDNSLVIDQWTSLQGTEITGSLSMKNSYYYDMVFEYKTTLAGSPSTYKLQWAAEDAAVPIVREVIKSDRLYRGFNVSGSPFFVDVKSGGTCAGKSFAKGMGLSISTAGRQASFTIIARDVYGNLRTTGGDVFRVRLEGADANSGIVTDAGDGTYPVVYTATVSGYYDMGVIKGASNVQGSPFRVIVLPGPRHVPSTNATGYSLTVATAGMAASIYITVRDMHGNPQPVLNGAGADGALLQLSLNETFTTSWASYFPNIRQDTTGASALTTFDYTIYKQGYYKMYMKAKQDNMMQIQGSPFKLRVFPSVACATNSPATGQGLTLATAGVTAHFTVQARDSWESNRYTPEPPYGGGDTFRVRIRTPGKVDIHGNCTDMVNSTYNCSYVPKVSNNNILYVQLATPGGLWATYYNMWTTAGMTETTNVDTQITLQVNWEGLNAASIPNNALTPDNQYGIRWRGFLYPCRADTPYTFFFTLGDNNDERIKLWVDNSLVIDQWTSLDSSAPAGTYKFDLANHHYDVRLEYGAGAGGISTTNVGRYKLLWENSASATWSSDAQVAKGLIRSERLYQQWDVHVAPIASGSPFNVLVYPALTCAATSHVNGEALTLATAGLTGKFSLQARDFFTNTKWKGGDSFSVSLKQHGKYIYKATMEYDMAGMYLVQYNAKITNGTLGPLRGIYDWEVTLRQIGGLYGFYYENTDFSDTDPNVAPFSKIEPHINLKLGYARPIADMTGKIGVKDIGPDYFSVRWVGQLRPAYSEVYTFHATVDDGLKLYVNGLLVTNHWYSKCSDVDGTIALVADKLYDIKLEYLELTGNATMQLMWSSKSTNKSFVPSERLYYTRNMTSVQGPPVLQLLVLPHITSSSTCTANGYGLSAATAGRISHFTIHARDEFHNTKTLTNDIFTVRIKPLVKGRAVHGSLVPATNPYGANHSVTYMTTVSGFYQAYATLARPGGLWATYYDDPKFTVLKSSRIDSSVDFAHWGHGPGDKGKGVDARTDDVGLTDGDTFTVRWMGFYMTTDTGLHQFGVGVAQTDERVRLWVDNSMIIDQWDHYMVKTGTLLTGSISLDTAGRLYDIRLEYKEVSGLAGIQLMDYSISKPSYDVIKSDALYLSQEISGSPFAPFEIQQAVTCATTSTMIGPRISSTTVGVVSSFTIQANDQYGNERAQGGDIYVARMFPYWKGLGYGNTETHACEDVSGRTCPVIVNATTVDRNDSSYVATYTSTQSGYYYMHTSIAHQGGLIASYWDSFTVYNDTHYEFDMFIGAVQRKEEVQWSGQFNQVPYTGMTADNEFAVRWAGFVRPCRSDTPYTFYTRLDGFDERVQLWVDNSLVIQGWTSLTGTEMSGTFLFGGSNSFYDIKLEYRTNSGSTNSKIDLLWYNNDERDIDTIAKGLIRTDRLYQSQEVGLPGGGSPYEWHYSFRDVTSGSRSYAQGEGLTVATAGINSHFTITARDQFDNTRTIDGDAWVVRVASTKQTLNEDFLSKNRDGNYSVTYNTTISGTYAVNVQQVLQGGLMASYYNNIWLQGDPAYTKVDPIIDFDWGTDIISSQPAGVEVDTGRDYVAVRWQGFIKPRYTEILTFSALTDDGVRLWVNSTKVIESWNTTGIEVTGSIYLQSGYMYDIKMEYKEVTGTAHAKLSYFSQNIRKMVVPSERLYHSPMHVCGSPFSLYVHPAVLCTSTSTVVGPGLSSSTAGVMRSFTIQAKDVWHNERTLSDDSFMVRVQPKQAVGTDVAWRWSPPLGFWQTQPVRTEYGTISNNVRKGRYNAKFTNKRAVSTYVHINNAIAGGLWATYYNHDNFTQPFGSALREIVDWSGTSLTEVPFTGLTPDNIYAIRWRGFVKPCRTDEHYTFFTQIHSDDERVRLWVDNSLIIDEWTSLHTYTTTEYEVSGSIAFATANAYYDIVLEYKSGAATFCQHTLKWENWNVTSGGDSTNKGVIRSDRLFQAVEVRQSPFHINVKPAKTHWQQTLFNGTGLTIGTVGHTSSFTIQTRDAYTNVRETGGNIFNVHIFGDMGPSDTGLPHAEPHVWAGRDVVGTRYTAINGNVQDLNNSTYIVTYTPWKKGGFENKVFYGTADKTFELVVLPALTCATYSTAHGAFLTLATAGTYGTFTIQSRDAGINNRTEPDDFQVYLTGPAGRTNIPVAWDNDHMSGNATITYLETASGMYSLNIRHIYTPGLNATYFKDDTLTAPVFTHIENNINHNWGADSPNSAVGDVDGWSGRWTGYVKPRYSGEYTFYNVIDGDDERVKLWIDNTLIINQWTSLNETAASLVGGYVVTGSVSLIADVIYDLKNEYKDMANDAVFRLRWLSASQSLEPIPSTHLYANSRHISGGVPGARFVRRDGLTAGQGSPWTLTMLPGASCGAVSTVVRGTFMSIQTAGIFASFTIQAKDMLGNNKTTIDDVFAVHIRTEPDPLTDEQEARKPYVPAAMASLENIPPRQFPDGRGLLKIVRDIHGIVTPLGEGRYQVYYKPRVRPAVENGFNDMRAHMGQFGGLQATYFNDLALTPGNEVMTIIRPTVDWSGTSADSVPYTGIEVDNEYSVRWAGFIRPCRSDQAYTFYAPLSADDERVRIWIDNSLVISQWTSLDSTNPSGTLYFTLANGYYDVKMEYSTGVSSANLKRHGLYWHNYDSVALDGVCYTGACAVRSDRLLQQYHIMGDDLNNNEVPDIHVHPAVAYAQHCTAVGWGLTVATAGVLRTFTVTSFDEFKNQRTDGVDAYMVRAFQNYSDLPTLGKFQYLDDHNSKHEGFYTVTLSGMYNLDVSLGNHAGHGVMATYYKYETNSAYQIRQGPRVNRYDATINFNWGRGRPVVDPAFPTDHFAVMWTGLIDPPYTETYTFYTRSDDGVRLMVDNKILINKWNVSGSEFSGTIAFSHQTLYDLRLDYHDETGNAYMELYWKSPRVPRQIVPSKHLWAVDAAIDHSPFTLRVYPAAMCATQSITWGQGLTLTTAGVLSHFTIQAKDQWGNNKTLIEDPFVVYMQQDGHRSVVATLTSFHGEGRYEASYTMYPAGQAGVYLGQHIPGGLYATFYNNQDVTGAYAKAIRSVIDWSGYAKEVPITGLTSDNKFSVRWAGFVRPCRYNDMYTFFTPIQNEDERVRLWVDNSLIINEWTSLSGTEPSGTPLAFDIGNEFYDIKMEYKTLGGQTPSSVQLEWASVLTTKGIIRSDRLFQRELVTGNPFMLTIRPTAVCAGTSTFAGHGLTFATAGVTTSFTIQAKDVYGNDMGYGGNVIVGRAFRDNCASCPPIVHGETVDLGNSTFTVSYTATRTGDYKVHASIAFQGGLWATYYDHYDNEQLVNYLESPYGRDWVGDYLESPWEVRVEPQVDWSGTASQVPMTGLTADRKWAARWAGFVKPCRADYPYTFFIPIESADERVQLWVDNSLIINQWTSISSTEPSGTFLFTSANALYDIKLEYKTMGGDTDSQFSLMWKSDEATYTSAYRVDKALIRSDRLYVAEDITGSQTELFVYPGPICASQSQGYGDALSLQTAGVPATFTIQGRDEFMNDRTLSSDTTFNVKMYGQGGYPIYDGIVDAYEDGNGLYLVSYTAFVAHNYEVYARVGLTNIHGSPFSLVVNSSIVCGSKSTATGYGLTASLLGVDATFTIQARDMYSNARFDGGDIALWHTMAPSNIFASRLLRPGYAAVHTTRTNTFSYGSYDIQYKTTAANAASGYWLLHVGLPIPGGLTATYYDTTTFTSPAYVNLNVGAVDYSHDLSTGRPDGSYSGLVGLSADNLYSVRWAGLLRPCRADTYTFFTDVQTIDERVRLWVDNSLIIDSWTSLAGTETSGTYYFDLGNDFYDITIEFAAQPPGTSSTGLSLLWSNDNNQGGNPTSKGVIRTDRLFQNYEIYGSPFTTIVS
jgi:hypothetical protein